jgi:hypothetical protein
VFKKGIECTNDDILIIRDMAVNNNFEERPNVRKSLRSYLEIIYLKQRMKIFVHGLKVQTKNWGNVLYLPCQYNYVTKLSSNKRVKEDLETTAKELKEGNCT